MHDDASIIIACEQVIRQFALLNDRHDHEGLAALFTADGVFARPSAPELPVHGREAILHSFRARPPRTTCHLMLNTLVSINRRPWRTRTTRSCSIPPRTPPPHRPGRPSRLRCSAVSTTCWCGSRSAGCSSSGLAPC